MGTSPHQGARDGRSRSVVIIDPSPMARAGLRLALEAAGHEVVAEVAGCESVDIRAARLSALAITNLGHGSASGLDLLRAAAPELRIPVLVEEGSDVAAAVQAGADGVLPTVADADRILAAMDDVLQGRAVLDPALALHALRMRPESIPDPDPLTPRELEVLRLLSEGNTNPQIAARLFLAVGTVKVHFEHILSKLGASDRTEAAVRAVSRGLLRDGGG
jgi:DNA-binding NarL/FixJ family response regulator